MYLGKRSSLQQRRRCGCKFSSRRIGSRRETIHPSKLGMYLVRKGPRHATQSNLTLPSSFSGGRLSSSSATCFRSDKNLSLMPAWVCIGVTYRWTLKTEVKDSFARTAKKRTIASFRYYFKYCPLAGSRCGSAVKRWKNEKINEIERTRVRSPPRATSLKKYCPLAALWCHIKSGLTDFTFDTKMMSKWG
jgi:hypothetical protein